MTTLAQGEGGHARPAFLPDGRHFLYRVTSGRRTGSVVVTSLDSADRTVLRDSDSTNVAYSAGHLLFLTGRTLMAQPFDPDRLALSGTPFPIAADIQTLGSPLYRLLRRVTRRRPGVSNFGHDRRIAADVDRSRREDTGHDRYAGQLR